MNQGCLPGREETSAVESQRVASPGKKKAATADGVSDNNEKPQINNRCIEQIIYYPF